MRFLLGLLVGLLLVPLGLYLYFRSGAAPVATSAPEMPFEKQIARMARRARISREMPKGTLISVDETNLAGGAHVYAEQCAVCHGLPGQDPTPVARGMYPKPPQLFRGKGVTDDTAGETYWKIANGIRLSGMPGFRQSLTETQMWQVSVLLTNAHSLPASAQLILGNGERAANLQHGAK